MNAQKILLVVLVALALLAFVPTALAQDDEDAGDVPAVVVVDDGEDEAAIPIVNFELPDWFQNLTIAGLAVAPVVVVVVQLLKAIMALVGVPEGYSGYVVLFVAVVATLLVFGAEFTGAQAEVANLFTVLERVAQAMLTFLSSLGIYKVSKAVKVMPAVNWKNAE